MDTQDRVRASNSIKADLFVSQTGNDTWSGRSASRDGTDGPLATLARARDVVRTMAPADRPDHGVIVELLGGTYELTEPLVLGEEDAGTPEKPVIYRARHADEVRLIGGKVLSAFSPVTDRTILDRLDPAARDHVVQTDLPDQGISDFSQLTAPGWYQGQPGLELFFRGERMTLARWPNEGFVHVASIDVTGNTPLQNRLTASGEIRGSNEGRFVYDGDRPARWTDEDDVWLHGHWFFDWADQRQKVASIDTEERTITMDGPDHAFGYRAGQWYYALNILAELDRPGEWYLDRTTGVIYFWPPAPLEAGDVSVSIAPHLIQLKETRHVVIQGMKMESVRGTAVTIDAGEDNLVCGCTIRNASSWGVKITGGTACGVEGCDLYALGEGGIWLEGGDRPTLTPGRHFALNNHIHHCCRWNPLYHPGIAMFGVGHRVAHNLLHDLPHVAIDFTGNDQIIEYNEIHSAVYMANDAGAIYTSPPTEELSMYGHTIRHNYVHHIYGFKNKGCNGAVYLDDFFPGTTICGNVFYKVVRATFVGGGRYNVIDNNIFVDCTPSVHVDARGLGWAAGEEQMQIDLLKRVPYQGELWRSRYPTLVDVLEDEPMVPKGNAVTRNICWRGSWDEIEDKARPHVMIEDNLVGIDPLFVDEAAQDFALRDESPAYELGFQAISFDRIGLYDDPLRASWPVIHQVREATDESW